jgi:hypothetical protein
MACGPALKYLSIFEYKKRVKLILFKELLLGKAKS